MIDMANDLLDSELLGFDNSSNRARPSQLLTPPDSHENSQGEEADDDVFVSPAFYPVPHDGDSAPDLVLMSTDSEYFYVHLHVLIDASKNGFNNLLEGGQNYHNTITVTEPSAVLQIILHAIYDTSCAEYFPSLDSLADAISSLNMYGIPLKNVIAPSRPLFEVLLNQAAVRPLDLYALAASHDLYDLAVAASPHLLSLSLSTITDAMALRMGPVYLKRLFFMHLGRAQALRDILLPPPYPHSPTPRCNVFEQQKLSRAWTLASACLAWDTNANISIYMMESTLRPLGDHLQCPHCQTALSERIKMLVYQWSRIKTTI